jgi:long-chain acyl-CoA synthetase
MVTYARPGVPPRGADEVSDRTTVGVFLRQAERFGSRAFLHHRTQDGWVAMSWTEVAGAGLRIAAALVAAGVAKGDRALLLSENRWEWLCCDLGIQAAGAITVPIYASTQARVARRIAADSGAVLAIVSGATQEAKLERADPLRRIVRLDGDVAEWLAGTSNPDPHTAREATRRLRELRPEDVATIVYTSGTTGDPKGAVLTHVSFTAMARAALEVFEVGPADAELSYLPRAHVLERTSGVFTAIAAGAEIWIARDMDQLAEDIQDVRPTVMLGVPRVFEKVLKAVRGQARSRRRPERALFDWAVKASRARLADRRGPLASIRLRAADLLVLGRLRRRVTGGRLRFFVSGGAPLRPEVEEFFRGLGVPIYQGWGLTETNSAATGNTPDAHRPGSVGRPLPGVDVRVEADGELLVRSPGNMLGYFRDPRATAEVFAGAWLRTGDVGDIDADGFVWVTDRKKDLIKTSGGKYVAPQPLEARLAGHPLIESAVVVGDERPYVTALIVPDWAALIEGDRLPGEPRDLLHDAQATARIQAVVDELNRDLAGFETVKSFRLLTRDFLEVEGELTPTFKVRRRVVEQRYRALIDDMYAGV